MLLIMADVIAICMVADVKTTKADVIAYCFWLMFLPLLCGRCYNHLFQYKVMADVIARWQM